MARTFTWLQPVGGNFDGSGNWGDITSGTLTATPDVPTPADIAVFNTVAVTVGSLGIGTAGTVDVAHSVLSLTGTVRFGALAIGASTLDVGAGGTLDEVLSYQSAAQIAVVVGADAVLNVAGTGARVILEDPVGPGAYLQVSGNGRLNVGVGGSVTADVLDLTGAGTSSALATIDGGSSTPGMAALLSAAWLAVGDGGPAALWIANGALAQVGVVTVGFGEAGSPGTGTLLVSNAGAITDGTYAALGFSEGDVGIVTIDGTGSSFASAGLFVGNAGAGSLTVQNGATLATAVEAGDSTFFAGAIANAPGGSGTVLVAGLGSAWAIAGRLDIGAGGAGTLAVLDGASVRSSAAPAAVVTNGATQYNGSFSLVQATVLVRDVGSTLDAGAGPIYVGNEGTATLSVEQGAAASASAPAPDFAAVQVGLNGGTGTLTVGDSGSTFRAVGQFDVGGTGGGAGTLLVLAGATLLSGAQATDPLAGLSLGDAAAGSGAATIEGAGSLVHNDGRLDIGRFGSGVLLITNGGTLSTGLAASVQASQPASVLIGVNAGASGVAYVDGMGSVLSTAQDLAVGLGSAGALQVTGGGRVDIATDFGIGNALGSGFAGSGQGQVLVAVGSISAGGSLALGESDAGYSGTGTLTLAAGAHLSVMGSATITAGSSIALTGGGLEIGGDGTASTGWVQVDAGATLAGAGDVQGSVLVNGTVAAAGGTLALTAASGPGTLALVAGGTLDLGSLSGGTVDFVSNGTLRLHAAASGTALLVGLDGGTIDLAGIVANSAVYSGGSLVVDLGATSMTMALAAVPPAGTPAVVADGAGGTEILIPCFAAGTRLATPAGWIAAEAVDAGDLLLTVGGRAARVVWSGRRTLDCRRHARPADVRPVRVRAGAFAAGVPRSDVLLSPDHALLVEGSLIPVRYLLNGTSIGQEAASRITYCHIELAAHDVLLAEGLPCESYLDTGNRAAFAPSGGAMTLHPDFAPPDHARAVWAEKGCAPLVLEGPALARARRHFLNRAAALGFRRSRNPALRVLAGERVLRTETAGEHWQVALPPGVAQVRLASRTWVPAHMRTEENDTRTLGVAVAHLALDGREVALDSPALTQGWLPPEPGWRWTDGAGVVPVAGARLLSFDLVRMGEYWARPADEATAAHRSAAG